MKLIFKLLILQSMTIEAALVSLSGNPSDFAFRVTNTFIEKHFPGNQDLFEWDLRNKSCIKRKDFPLQLCFKKDDFFVIQVKKEDIRNSLGHIQKISLNTKGLQDEDLGLDEHE